LVSAKRDRNGKGCCDELKAGAKKGANAVFAADENAIHRLRMLISYK